MNNNSEVTEKDVRKLAAKETDKAVKELQGISNPADEGIRTKGKKR